MLFEHLYYTKENMARINTDRAQLSESLTATDIRQFVEKNMAKLDKDINGVISFNELDEFKPANEKEKESVRYLKDHIHEVKHLSNDAYSWDSGISRKDLVQFEMKNGGDFEQKQEKVREVVRSFLDNFDKIDKDKSGQITKRELDAAAKDPQLDAGARYMVSFMRKGFDRIIDGNGYHPGLNRELITAFGRNIDFDKARSSEKLLAVGSGALGLAAASGWLYWIGAAGLASGPGLVGLGLLGMVTLATTTQLPAAQNDRNNKRRILAWELINDMEKVQRS